MATTSQIQSFIANMSGYATEAGNSLGISPNLVLAQWGLESGYGTSSIAQNDNNYGGLGGSAAPLSFSGPQSFEQAYVNTIQNNFSGAVNSGSNLSDFALGLYGLATGNNNPSAVSAAGNSTNGYSFGQTGTSYETALSGALGVINQFFNPSASGSNGTATVPSTTTGTGSAVASPSTTNGSASTSCTWYNFFLKWSCLQAILTNYMFVIVGLLLIIGMFITLLMSNKTVQSIAKKVPLE